MYKKVDRKAIRAKKHYRIRKNLAGTPECPRLAVFRSNQNIYAQIIDDVNGTTLVAAGSRDAFMAGEYGGNIAAAKKGGQQLAAKALEKGIKTVIFDRGGALYHGRIAALADGAREGGLEF